MKEVSETTLSKLKNWFESLFSGEWFSSLDIIKLGVCFGVSFLLGLLFKKSFKYIILYTLSLIIILSGLHYCNIICVDIIEIKTILGLSEIGNWTDLTQYVAQQMQAHVVEVSISSVGLVLGFKVG